MTKVELDRATAAALLAEAAKVPTGPIGVHLEDSEYVDYEGGYLSESDFKRVDAHIRSCHECAARMDDFCQAMQDRPASKLQELQLATRTHARVGVAWASIAAAVAIASLGLSGWLMLREAKDRQSLSDTQHLLAERNQVIQKLEAAAVAVASHKPPAPTQTELTQEPVEMARVVFELRPSAGAERGGSGAAAITSRTIPANVKVVELRFLLSKDEMRVAAKYNLQIFDEEAGQRITNRSGLNAQRTAAGPALAILVPKIQLRPGRYSATVDANGDALAVASYAFTILRQ